MGRTVVWWPRRHSVARLSKVGDWVGLGSKNPTIVPFVLGGSSGEPVANGLRHDLERAGAKPEPVVRRPPGRPVGSGGGRK